MVIRGKTVLITGSMTGIGLGIAKAFAAAGVNVVMNGIHEADFAEPQRAEVEALGVRAVYYQADVSDAKAVNTMMTTADAEFGGVDIVINNAGIQHVAPLEEFPPEKWEAILSVNLSAAFYVCKAAVPLMKRSGWGRLINIASAHGLVASPFKSAYVASKHGIIGLTKTLALELGEDHITSNAICPGYVLTPLVEEQIADTARARGISEEAVIKDVMLAAQWTKKFVTVEQLAGTALFLCSDHAENITGAAIPVDGGWTAA